ncbi:hypothetical protein DNTS_018302 [Danionella cerebrum]|uniref:Uncharacterized protein n=1 Tax=Danionella cerebrum TaxID=2873325 RepID=A0A553QEM4_9TELE|nr:hypothetical protein DNTS_018302 [Danionella translucida]TRY88391.1 hypothetical protein DNTS_018302 [Danionella translucida]
MRRSLDGASSAEAITGGGGLEAGEILSYLQTILLFLSDPSQFPGSVTICKSALVWSMTTSCSPEMIKSSLEEIVCVCSLEPVSHDEDRLLGLSSVICSGFGGSPGLAQGYLGDQVQCSSSLFSSGARGERKGGPPQASDHLWYASHSSLLIILIRIFTVWECFSMSCSLLFIVNTSGGGGSCICGESAAGASSELLMRVKVSELSPYAVGRGTFFSGGLITLDDHHWILGLVQMILLFWRCAVLRLLKGVKLILRK